MNKPKAIIVDMDGTLAIKGDRSVFDYSKVDLDTINLPIAQIVRAVVARYGYKVIITSGREDYCKDLTIEWLKKHDIPFDKILMRITGDHETKDYIVKQGFYLSEIKYFYDVVFALDDRQQVVDMWRSEGLLCLQVAKGDF